MRSSNRLPPPVAFTPGDKLRLSTSVLILALGAVILCRTLPVAFTVQALVVGGAFVGFGVYRLALATTRLKQWKSNK